MAGSLPVRLKKTRQMKVSERAVTAKAPMFRMPLRAGSSHVMQLRPIGIAGNPDQPVPPRHDHVQVLAKRHRHRLRDPHGALSVRLAQHGRKRHAEDLFAVIIADVQDPAAPIFQDWRRDERAHNEGGVVTRLGQIGDSAAASIETPIALEQ